MARSDMQAVPRFIRCALYLCALSTALGLTPPLVSRRAVLATTAILSDGGLGSRVDELKTLGTRAEQSQRAEVPEFWPGRLEGKPPPKPKVVLRNAPPIVIFPGFGNDRVDYLTPNGLPVEVGLAAALNRRGVSEVSVVPIDRSDWLNVAKGLGDLAFVRGDAQPEGPAFSWYLQAAKRTVEEAVKAAGGQRVVLLGHSAGGWLARALCVTAGDAWATKNVRGIVTLGAPHASPPPQVADQTRGTIPNVNLRAPGAYLAPKGVFYVTVASTRVIGDEKGDASARNGFTSYNLVLGKAQGVQGDGFVPLDSAHLEGATRVTLNCYHSGGSADAWPKDDWYGAERNVDAWLGTVGEALEGQGGAGGAEKL